ncbi:MAG TPA: ImmA/IrrE family metallo-endopeptidase [Candidatus Saccharimonadales bacterium]|nr:ImmA/IrrE family metallo-endopeptidase [Candidatus Saccharimonadales bacterium]
MDTTKIRLLTRSIREKHGVHKPPVNVFDIAANEEIDVVYFSPPDDAKDVSGLLVKEEKRVYLNADEPMERRAFTLAHELAHYFLEHEPSEYGVYRRSSLYLSEKSLTEREADRFAAELLMPQEFVTELMKKYSLTARDTDVLAKMFVVSQVAMDRRLKELGIA